MENAVAERAGSATPRGQEPPGDLSVSLKTEAGRICLSASRGSDAVRLSLISDAPSVEMMPETLASAGRVMQKFAEAVRERKVISRAALDLVGAAMGETAPAVQIDKSDGPGRRETFRVDPGMEALCDAIADPTRGRSMASVEEMLRGRLNTLNTAQKLKDPSLRREHTIKDLQSIISIACGKLLDLHG